MKLDFIQKQLLDSSLMTDLSTVVDDPISLIPQSEEDFSQLCKFGLYPADGCQPFVTKQGTPFYHLDNMSVLPLGKEENWMHYGDFRFRQIEVLYNMVRMDSVDAHNWLKDNLFQKRVDARKKQEYKAKFRASHRHFGCNVLGKLLSQLKETKGKLPYCLPEDLHLFGKPILSIR